MKGVLKQLKGWIMVNKNQEFMLITDPLPVTVKLFRQRKKFRCG